MVKKTTTIREVELKRSKKSGEPEYFRQRKGSRMSSSEIFCFEPRQDVDVHILVFGSLLSESDFESDHDLTIVLVHSDVSFGLQRYLNKKEQGIR